MLKISAETMMETGAPEAKAESFQLPDGTKIDLGADRTRISEIMFNSVPDVSNFTGIQRMIADAIVKSDLDIRKELYSNIVISGGNTLIEGFLERVQKLVPEVAPPNMKSKVIAHTSPERKISPWIGGSILSSLGSFQQMWMSKQEFEEHGGTLILVMFPPFYQKKKKAIFISDFHREEVRLRKAVAAIFIERTRG